MSKNKLSLLISSLLVISTHTQANNIDISGFASFKLSSTLNSNDYIYGISDDFNIKDESLFALQFKSDLNDKFSVTAQLMSKGKEDYDVGFEWAYITYKIDNNNSIQAGRLRAPFYKYSEFMDVGYAYSWLRVPQSVYAMGYDNIDGLSYLHRRNFLGFDTSVQFSFGQHNSDISISGIPTNTKVHNMYGASTLFEKENYGFRLAHFRGKLDLTNFVFSDLSQVTTPISSLIPELSLFNVIEKNDAKFSVLGFFYDDFNYIFKTEITRSEIKESFIPVQRAFYVTAGKRFNDLTAYVSFEEQKNNKKNLNSISLLPTELGSALNTLLDSTDERNKTYSLGFRKDITPSVAFKTQYSFLDNKSNTEKGSLFSVGFDVVF